MEHAEVLGDVLLRRPDRFAQVEHARFSHAQAIEQLDPGRLAQDAETLRDQHDEVVRKRVREGDALSLPPSERPVRRPSCLFDRAHASASVSLLDRRPERRGSHPQPR